MRLFIVFNNRLISNSSYLFGFLLHNSTIHHDNNKMVIMDKQTE
jgi:hypothetical protein